MENLNASQQTVLDTQGSNTEYLFTQIRNSQLLNVLWHQVQTLAYRWLRFNSQDSTVLWINHCHKRYTASNGTIIMWLDALERIRKEVICPVWGTIPAFPRTDSGEKKLSHDSQCLVWDVNPRLPKHQFGALTNTSQLWPQCALLLSG
jgi:hypothetical protein